MARAHLQIVMGFFRGWWGMKVVQHRTITEKSTQQHTELQGVIMREL